MKWNEHIFQHQQRFTYVKYFNNVKILQILLAVDCTFKAINLPRIKGKKYKKLPKPFTLLVKVCLLKNVFFDNSPSSCDIKKQKKSFLIWFYSQHILCLLVFENDFGPTIFIQQMMIIMSLMLINRAFSMNFYKFHFKIPHSYTIHLWNSSWVRYKG